MYGRTVSSACMTRSWIGTGYRSWIIRSPAHETVLCHLVARGVVGGLDDPLEPAPYIWTTAAVSSSASSARRVVEVFEAARELLDTGDQLLRLHR